MSVPCSGNSFDLRRIALWMAFVACATAGAEPRLQGRFCVLQRDRSVQVARECTLSSGRLVPVTAAESDRRFLWVSEDGSDLAIGTIERGRTIADVRAKDAIEVALAVSGSDPAEWPQPLSVLAAVADETYGFTLPARTATTVRQLRLAPGTYALQFDAPNHRPVKKTILARAGRVPKATVVLERYPQLRGRVRECSGGTPIAGAEIRLPSGEALAVTDAGGQFVGVVAEDWPKTVLVAAAGYGTRVLALPAVVADADLHDIDLGRGGAIRVELSGVSEASLVVSRILDARTTEPVASARVTATQAHVFPDLEAGAYLLLAKGDEPLERYAVRVTVEEAATASTVVTVAPVALETTVRAGKNRAAAARLLFRHAAMQWEGEVTTDAAGTATTALWQQGEFAVLVTVPKATVPFFLLQRLAGADRIAWTAELPERKVVGEVLDERKLPVAKATLFLESRGGEGRGQMRTQTDASGRFEFSYVPPGTQVLTVSADGFMPEMRHFQLAESAESHATQVVLQRAVAARVVVTDARGVPLAGCAVIDSLQTKDLLRTDDAGAVTIPLRPRETKVVYFLPRRGSFAAASITAQARPGDDPIHVAVPPGDVSIVVRARTEDGDPVPHVAVAMRVNGFVIPPGVMEAMLNLQGLRASTDPSGVAVMANLPAGTYELWPYFSYKEAMDIFNGLGPEPPVRLVARPGENVATLTFAEDGQ